MRLLVIGNKLVRDVVACKLLKKIYVVDFSRTGIDGVYLAHDNPYDVLIVEDTLRDIDGEEVCRRIRASNVTTPLLFINSKDIAPTKTGSLDSGADVCFTGSIEPVELCAQLRSLIRRTFSIQQEVICHGNVKVDLHARNVFACNNRIDLRRKEFDILAYLIMKNNIIVTKEELLEHVWDKGLDVCSNTVEVHVKQLRDKLEKYCGRSFIKTVRNFGYTLVC